MSQANEDDGPLSPVQAPPGPARKLPQGLRNVSHNISSKTAAALGAGSLPMSHSESSLPYRHSNPSHASLYASTLSPPGSRSMSPAGRGSPSRPLSGGMFDSVSDKELTEAASDNPGDPLNLILKAFVPHVTIYNSKDVDDLMRDKGFKHGIWELLRPFGERVQGRVSVRDSSGVSRPVDDFAIRFTQFGSGIEHPDTSSPGIRSPTEESSQSPSAAQASAARDRKLMSDVETLVERHLTYAEESYANGPQYGLMARQGLDIEAASPYYALYLRRLLSGFRMAPHETFAHPVACVTAISSRNTNRLEELQRLYAETASGEQKLPPWVDSEYLRYYVLIHDEDNGDIRESNEFFEKMKRTLGPHCAMLRLRGHQCLESDDDSIPLPRAEWMTAQEELAEIHRSEADEEFEEQTHHIYESDATNIRSFVREMITQSIVPTMERHISVWNDQVASRRKGLAGTFTNFTKRFTFGSRASTGGGNVKEGFDPAGFYWAQAPDAILRKLADYAFMLRDWKLAYSTYDMLRAGFAQAKAWKYQAAADEMTAISHLMVPQSSSSRTRWENVENIIQEAVYSYSTRCSSPYGALRSMLLPVELLRLRGGPNVDGAGRLGVRLLEANVLGAVGDALVKERLAINYSSKKGAGSWSWGSRARKAGMWSYLAADAWLHQEKYIPSQRCLNYASNIYVGMPHGKAMSQFTNANALLGDLQRQLSEKLDSHEGASAEETTDVEEESEALTSMNPRRNSSIIPGGGLVETAPLRGEEESVDDTTAQADFDKQESGN